MASVTIRSVSLVVLMFNVGPVTMMTTTLTVRTSSVTLIMTRVVTNVVTVPVSPTLSTFISTLVIVGPVVLLVSETSQVNAERII